ncbi:hypothetical protein Dimus_016203 [Dionaea muscipula]
MPPPTSVPRTVHGSGLHCESSSSCSEGIFIASVKHDCIPYLNQQFDSLDDVQTFYNNYAKEAGFGTRSSSSRKNRKYEIVRKEYRCFKQGVGVQTATK